MEIESSYVPREQQWNIHENLKRFNVLVCHRRFGKSVMLINELIKRCTLAKRDNERYYFFAPTYRQAKAIIWDYLKVYAGEVPGVRFNEAELRSDFPNGARIQLYGAIDPDAVRGLYADGVVFDEYQDTDPRIWTEIMRPAVSDYKGFVIFSGTPKGKNHFYDKYKEASENKDWFSCVYKASETSIIDDEELDLAWQQMSEDEYMQEYECSFEAAIKGSYYGDYIKRANEEEPKRITVVPKATELPVHTAWDLGISDSTAIWFYQATQAGVRLIDYYESSGVGLDHYVKVLKDKEYLYGTHYLPHDARVTELGTGKSRIETLVSLGIDIKNIDIVPNIGVEDGINAVRLILDRCWFDQHKCRRGIEALSQYRREWNDKTQDFKNRPLHDWTSHAADAFRYLAVSYTEKQGGPKNVRFERTLNEMLAEHDQIMEERRWSSQF